ncbi:MAG: hypothetical protein FOGNACKC_01985 [Anaerolineae bacterium]|nr:hypothetical protein [Anaerolineae bacterium]
MAKLVIFKSMGIIVHFSTYKVQGRVDFGVVSSHQNRFKMGGFSDTTRVLARIWLAYIPFYVRGRTNVTLNL